MVPIIVRLLLSLSLKAASIIHFDGRTSQSLGGLLRSFVSTIPQDNSTFTARRGLTYASRT